jgi:hypothetical protein
VRSAVHLLRQCPELMMSRVARASAWAFALVATYSALWLSYALYVLVVQPLSIQEHLISQHASVAALSHHERSFAFDGLGEAVWEYTLPPSSRALLEGRCAPATPPGEPCVVARSLSSPGVEDSITLSGSIWRVTRRSVNLSDNGERRDER